MSGGVVVCCVGVCVRVRPGCLHFLFTLFILQHLRGTNNRCVVWPGLSLVQE